MAESILDLLFDPAKKQRPRRLMVYGPDGVGKSTFAASAPDPVFVTTEDGLRGIKGAIQFPVAKDLETFCGYVAALKDPSHGRKTLVVDSTTGLTKLIDACVAAKAGKSSVVEIGFGKERPLQREAWDGVLNLIEDVSLAANMTVVLLGHAKNDSFKPPDGDNYNRWVPKLPDECRMAVCEWCDEYFFATYKVFTKTEGEGKGATKKAIGSGDRIMKTTGAGAFLAKRRIEMPDELPLSWDAYQYYVDGGTDEQQAGGKF